MKWCTRTMWRSCPSRKAADAKRVASRSKPRSLPLSLTHTHSLSLSLSRSLSLSLSLYSLSLSLSLSLSSLSLSLSILSLSLSYTHTHKDPGKRPGEHRQASLDDGHGQRLAGEDQRRAQEAGNKLSKILYIGLLSSKSTRGLMHSWAKSSYDLKSYYIKS